MAHKFFGPWRVVVKEFDPIPPQGFVISGSDDADGFYVPKQGVPMDIAVSGAEWTIDLQVLMPFEPMRWTSFEGIQTTRFVAPEGLTVRLNHGGDKVLFLGPFILSMTLLCISMDPDINPIPILNPFDFTAPEG
jgi:hypothetical protein